jgi:hypothetical protein
MPRPYTDIQAAISGNVVKNGTAVVSTTFTGKYSTNNNYVKNTPPISTIYNKYGNKFYNGIFVKVLPSGT